MSRGPLVAVVAIAAVAGVAGVLLFSGGSPEQGLTGLGPEGPTAATSETVAPPTTRDPGTTTPLDPFTMKRPDTPIGPGPTEGPKGPGSKFSAKRGTKRQSQNQRAGRLLDNLEQAVTASDGSAIEDMISKLLAMGEEALPDLIDALQRADITNRALRKAIINALQRIPKPAAANALMQLALDGTDDRELRKIATLALGTMPAEVAVQPLTRIYRHRGDAGIYAIVRGQALTALATVGGDDAYAVVLDAAQYEEDPAVRRLAVAGLGSNTFAQPGKIEMLLKIVRVDADEGVRRWAMSSLGSSEDPRARQELAGLLGEWPEPSMRTTLYYSLQKRKDTAVEQTLADALERESETVMVKRAASALMTVLGKDARKYLERSRDRFQGRADLKLYFESLLRALDNPNSHGTGHVKPPGAPK